MRKRGRVDAVQKEIVEACQKIGASIISLTPIGAGCPDLLVGFRGKNFLFECKTTKKSVLTQDQTVLHKTFKGKIFVVYSIIEAINILLKE